MKRLLSFFCLILCSCEQSSDCCDCCSAGPIGVHFSKSDKLSFNMQEGIDSAFVLNGAYWWFDDKREEFNECKFIEPAKEPNYCDNNYCNNNKENIMKIECSWFNVVKKNDSTILVSVNQNDTERKRSQAITIAGNISVNDGKVHNGTFRIIQCHDIIELSEKEFLFAAKGGVDSVTVATNRSSWLNPSIGVEYETVYYERHFYNEDFGSSPAYSYIEDSWFTINITDGKKIIFSVSKNETGKKRELSIIIDVDNCGEKIYIHQSAE